MKLYFNTQPAAQGRATALHNQIKATNPEYSASVDAGQTLRWTNVSQDLDANGVPVNAFFWITVRDRCLPHVTGPEAAAAWPDDQIGNPR